MCALVEPCCSRLWSRFAVITIMAAGVAACSADTSRFNDNPLGNPYASRGPTGREVAAAPAAQPAPVARVETQPLSAPPQAVSALPPPQPNYGGSDVTGSVAAPPPQVAAARGNWNGATGTAVTVERGDTVDTIARRFGVPASTIMQANNLRSPSVLPGQRLIIPASNHTPAPSAPTPRLASNVPATPARQAQASTVGGVHIVQPGETLSSLGRHYGKTRMEIARANNLAQDQQLRIGQQVMIPGIHAAPARPVSPPVLNAAATPAPIKQAAAPVAAPKAPAAPASKVANAEPVANARMATPATEQPEEAATETTGTAPSFRWPARGRVIAGFGPKPNGQQNDGINLAVPEGTSIKASDDGVVAYAGNELKGYGNLVLVRHSNGYVTAYAHASELLVKRGDPVKRGQMIGRAGQTGNVASPQLHFEIRKGKDPVDPMQYLSGG